MNTTKKETALNVLILIDHPWEGSFNYTIMEAFSGGLREKGHSIDRIDLNEDQFNPVFSTEELAGYAEGISLDPQVKDYQERLRAADHLVMIFPIWWNVMPARMKGWMDKVLLPGFAFSKGQFPEPMLGHIRGGTVLTTTGAPDDVHRKEYHNALHWVLCKGTLEFCGISPVEWLNFGETGFVPWEAHEDWLAKVRTYAKGL